MIMDYLSTGRRCLECGEPLRGRADKKYCSTQCRSMYNNRLNSDVTNFVRHINHILRKNRRILATLNPEGKARIHREKLLEMGFPFRFSPYIQSLEREVGRPAAIQGLFLLDLWKISTISGRNRMVIIAKFISFNLVFKNLVKIINHEGRKH